MARWAPLLHLLAALPSARGEEQVLGGRPECSEAEAHVERYVTKAERQLHLLEHALGPYARGERNSFHSPLRLTKDQEAVDVASFDALLAHYHGELAAQHGADPGTWDGDKDAQRLVMELTTQFLQAAEPDFRVEEQK